jgi:predicted N-acetyltransferase YhbS
MTIRKATYHDAPAIRYILEVSCRTTRISILIDQLETRFDKDDHLVFVCERRKEVAGPLMAAWRSSVL